MNFWRSVRQHTAREVSEVEYRIVDRAMRTNDPSTISAAIAAVGNPPSLRMLFYQVERALEKTKQREQKEKRASQKATGKATASEKGTSWWTRLTSSRKTLHDGKDPKVKAIKDKVFFSRLWTAVEPYVVGNLTDSQHRELAAAFRSGRASVVLDALDRSRPAIMKD